MYPEAFVASRREKDKVPVVDSGDKHARLYDNCSTDSRGQQHPSVARDFAVPTTFGHYFTIA